MTAIPDSQAAHHCWRCGWEDADTEMLGSRPATSAFWRRAWKTTIRRPGEFSSTLEGMHV